MQRRNTGSLVGQVFSNLIVLERHPEKGHNSKWVCQCKLCGGATVVTRPNLCSGNTVDCGCARTEKASRATTKHGWSGSELHKRWLNMRNRVRDPKKPYIRRGITVCKEWSVFENFLEWALNTNFDTDLELDRIDNAKGYSSDNCRWVTHAENCKNKSQSGLQYAVVNDLGEWYPSARAASRAYNLHKDGVSKAVNSKGKAAGRHWRKAEEQV